MLWSKNFDKALAPMVKEIDEMIEGLKQGLAVLQAKLVEAEIKEDPSFGFRLRQAQPTIIEPPPHPQTTKPHFQPLARHQE